MDELSREIHVILADARLTGFKDTSSLTDQTSYDIILDLLIKPRPKLHKTIYIIRK